MQFSVLLSLRVTQPTWRLESSHMACCSSVGFADWRTAVICKVCILTCTYQKEIGIVVLQPLRWRCVDCVIHHERDVREE